MGEENSTPRSHPEIPKKRVDAGGVHSGSVGASAGEEATLDPVAGAAGTNIGGPMSIGPYVLVKTLGEGGMGQVWLAEQTAPVKRKVALKLIKGGLYDSAVIQRFESERQSLAVMNHPAIAKVFDAGSTKDGQPYFVMEYVDGPPITRYCDNKKLKIPERLALFIKVCEGVQHAHQKAIIHRDLKPSNVLVVEVDGKPVPRIIDFGIAKAVSSQANAEQAIFTQAGAVVGTPGFMSPEQADPRVQDVDTRTDVYSLGVILYVLLTGMLPFDAEQSKKRPLDENLRQLREADPPSPSAKLSGEKHTARDSASNRAIEPRQLVSLLRGELDWITVRALERDRARRYGAPSELASDIERYLQNRPVVAGPASKAYRLRKYVGRHRVGAALAAGLALLLAGFAVMQAGQLRRISRERDRANRITDFMTNMFKVSDPSEARGNSITAREILDKSSKDIDTSLAKDPELQAQLIDVMGNVYTSLGLYEKGGSLLARAAATRRRVLGPKNPDTLRSMGSVAWNLQRAGHHAEAEKLGRETLNSERKVLGPENRDTLKTEGDLAWTLYEEGKYAEAEELFRHTLEIQRRVLGQEDKETILSMSVLGWTLGEEGHYAEAEKMEREAVDSGRRALGPLNPTTLGAMNNLAGILFWQGRYPDADHLYRELIDLYRRGSGPEHPDTLLATKNLANLLDYEGRYQEAADLQRETLEVQRRTLGPEHRDTLLTQRDLAGSLGGLGKYDEAEKLLYQTRDIQRRLMGPESPRTATTTYGLACLAVRRGRHDDAFSFLREAIEHGLSPAEDIGIESDPDLKSLHDDPRFAAIVADGKQRAATATKR
jgi:serine/threonine protein kinase